MDTILTQPSAAPVIQSLRSLGYNSKTALADLVDNCLDANSSEIIIEFSYSEENGMIKIIDNGHGMDDKGLQLAMNIGSKDPREGREPDELGRFGMGLKTASFSMGKRLSVLTKRNGVYSERCWDLDHVSHCNEWRLYRKIPEVVKKQMGEIKDQSGTIVAIDKLDRFMGSGSGKVIKESSFFSKIRRIHEHLEFVFHSIIEKGIASIYVNGNLLDPWDPFLSRHPSTIEGELQVIRMNSHRVKVKYFILPHASNLNEQEYRQAGGPKGWRDQQGFYVYRGNRLLYYGDWLGLFQKDTPSQLVRIRIDLTNEADNDWQVDIKKSSVIPPDGVKRRLESIARLTRKISRDIFYFRTKPVSTVSSIKGSLNTWENSGSESGPEFILNRNHPILIEILNNIDDDTAKLLNFYLKLVQVGSPSNIIDSPKVDEEKVQDISEVNKELLVQFATTMMSLNVVATNEQLINSLITQPAFDGINRATIKFILEKGNIGYGNESKGTF